MPRGPVILEPSWYEEVMNAGLVQRFVSMVLSFMKCPSCHNRLYADVVFDERISYSWLHMVSKIKRFICTGFVRLTLK